VVKNIAGVQHLDQTVLLQNPLGDAAKENRYKVNAAVLPKEGTPVTVIMEPAPTPQVETPPGSRRIHLLIAGSVQGVGFREFTKLTARKLGVTGWARNLPSGEVELEAEGVEAAMKEFEEKVAKGPRTAKVEKVQAVKASADALDEFDIRETPAK
jgi:acylphosphatase